MSIIYFKEPHKIFLQAEACWEINFVADDIAYSLKPVTNTITTDSYLFCFTSISAFNQALAAELFLKCLSVIEKECYLDKHPLTQLFKFLPIEIQNRIEKHYESILKNNTGHQKWKNKFPEKDYTLFGSLKRSANTFINHRYNFNSDFNELGFELSNSVNAFRTVILELKPDWIPFRPPMK